MCANESVDKPFGTKEKYYNIISIKISTTLNLTKKLARTAPVQLAFQPKIPNPLL